ncbi:hypothetical protein PAXINDRAFT_19712 [Paxillus involutus ATCC 200175]|uniref:Unplaced genomic scaffold PAXINscaffold_704, whole genome shotgun sequence n=1 Tax=Paxillus involutus ATCC 200175 TaxID=664439 RepID=A0A0C9TGB3_PAXIN|nr:hypothetical protein PAXINDRAFT_19712 [Paxillus involutus ATCC 200175]
MTSSHSCFLSLRGETFHVVAIAVAIVVVFVVLMTGLLSRLAEPRDDRPRGPAGPAYRRGRPRQHTDQNIVSAASLMPTQNLRLSP